MKLSWGCGDAGRRGGGGGDSRYCTMGMEYETLKVKTLNLNK
jgi:hypothetical protein